MLAWVKRAKDIGATHIILVYDKEDKDQYPVFVKPEENVDEKAKRIRLSEGKQEVIEIVRV
jgi:hypothetical protein